MGGPDALAHGPVACELHGPVIACDLFCALPSLVAYERPGRNSLYVLVWHYLPTCCARYRCQALHLTVPWPLRRRPLLAPDLLRALVVPKGSPPPRSPPPPSPSRWWLIMGRFCETYHPASEKNKNTQKKKNQTRKPQKKRCLMNLRRSLLGA